MSNRGRQPVRTSPQVTISHTEEYKNIFFSGIFGGLTPNGGQIILYLDRLEPEIVRNTPGALNLAKINRELLVELHCSPARFKSMAAWMAQKIKDYESQFGEIKLGPQKTDDHGNPLVQ